jgi:hypothetical protein
MLPIHKYLNAIAVRLWAAISGNRSGSDAAALVDVGASSAVPLASSTEHRYVSQRYLCLFISYRYLYMYVHRKV